ncbi:MAG: 30S ribosomal protein S20 [Myxococcales bacterium]|nr:30S ribosomal protein S20 [Myxococcales bacterium]
MASHKSAKKRARQTIVRNARNRHERSRVRTAVKKLRSTLSEGDAEAASSALKRAESLIRRAASKGILPKQRASRTISRLTKATHRI